MLFDYQKRVQELVSDLRQQTLNPAVAAQYINTARGQVAGEGECIRAAGAVSTVAAQRPYGFSGINLGVSTTTGIAGAIHVRRIMYGVGAGFQWMRPRNWEWFDIYKLNTPVPRSGPPEVWAQYAQGVNGSFFIDPLPDDVYALDLDCVCYPVTLLNDQTVEALPYLWTDAVPYFAAYLAYLAAQNDAAAKNMFGLYQEFMRRARQFSNPSVNRYLYQQAGDPAQVNKLSVQGKG